MIVKVQITGKLEDVFEMDMPDAWIAACASMTADDDLSADIYEKIAERYPDNDWTDVTCDDVAYENDVLVITVSCC